MSLSLYRWKLLVPFCLMAGNVFAQGKSNEAKADSVLQLMTLEEKVGQLNQYSGRVLTGPASSQKTNLQDDIRKGWVGSMLNVKGVKETREVQAIAMQSRLKIPLLFSLDVIHGYKTVFPIPLAEACSWDMNAIRQSAHIAAKEAAAAGLHWTFAPMVDIGRDPRWGRVMEGAGEDVYLGKLVAAARVKGFQGETLGGTDALLACAKHFAAYGAATAGRDYNAVDMSNQMLWETYLPPFKAAVDAGAATFMNSFNTLNGIPATGNSYLQRDILKGLWQFKGFVVSDWGSIGEMVPHGYAADDKDAGIKAITAGSDMDMESRVYKNHLVELVKQNKVPLALLDDAVKRILLKKFELGLFDDPYKFCNEQRETAALNDVTHVAIARDVAKRSIVLLQNNNQLLPLTTTAKKVAVIGPLVKAKRDMAGSWSVEPVDTNSIVNIWDGLLNNDKAKRTWLYAKGCNVEGTAVNGFTEAVSAAKAADVAIVVIGETWDMSGEAKSRTSITIPGKQIELLKAIKATGKPVVVVVMAGRPLLLNEVQQYADAIVYAWWLGSEAGNALADVLYGNYNPSGKLVATFPLNGGQIPISYEMYNTGRPVKNLKDIKYKSAYIDAPNTPLYAFGYGLSYTRFTYSNFQQSAGSMNASDSITVQCTLANTGKYAGEEVVQLYIRDKVSSVVRPLKELKGFQKITLQPGEKTTVRFVISKEQLSFFNRDLQWVAEPGEFDIMMGTASDNIQWTGKLILQ